MNTLDPLDRSRGFTLVEIMTVIAIIGILAALIFVATQSTLASGRDARRQGELVQVKKVLQQYYLANNSYPITNDPAGISLENDSDTNGTFTQTMKGGGYLPLVPRDPKYTGPTGEYAYKYIATTTDSYTLCAKSESKGGYICTTQASDGVALSADALVFGEWGGKEHTVEDFTTYTEVDPNGHITVNSSRIDFTNLGRDEDAYVYKDMGVGYFSGDFEQRVTFKYTSSTNGKVTIWGMANSVDDFDNVYPFLKVQIWHNGSDAILGVFADATWQNLEYMSPNTTRYLTIKRVESEGANGRIYCYEYRDAARTDLVASVYASPSAKIDFRYIYAAASHNGGYNSMPMTGYVENLDLVE